MLHEFRAQTLFALGRYQEAAGVEYAVLSAGPGWDWTTLSSLYPNVDVYTKQLRALEDYRNQHPDDGAVRFLLASQYITCGYSDNAATELKSVIKLNPQDQLSQQLLAGLTTTAPPADQPPAQPVAPTTPAAPVTAANLAGNWKSARPDGSSIALDLGKDSKYTWKFTRDGKSQDFSGSYNVADNLLVLNEGTNPVMVGQVAAQGGNSFNFKMVGAARAIRG